MTPKSLAFSIVLAAVPLLAGCRMEFDPTRPDATPFAAADGDCWEYAAAVAPGDAHPAMYAKCMARHGWVSCGRGSQCRSEAW